MVNRAILIGRLTKDPELRKTGNDIPVANFTLAVNRPFKNQQGDTDADFIEITTWRKTAEIVCEYLHKGAMVAVEGRIETGSYEDREGQKRKSVKVIADSVQFLETKRKEEPQEDLEDVSDDDVPF